MYVIQSAPQLCNGRECGASGGGGRGRGSGFTHKTQTLKCILNRFFIHSALALEFIHICMRCDAMRCDYNMLSGWLGEFSGQVRNSLRGFIWYLYHIKNTKLQFKVIKG